ncbi:MAG: N-acetylmuramoyl-L-alanine amidase [Bacteroidales bacterium]|nr:N-acetylmuramoyl-L-alanine amidase [Bacteroidales bacterium]
MQKILIALAMVLFLSFSAEVVEAQSAAGKKLEVVVIDPGHGGKDPGAIGKTAKEKDIVLAVALKLGSLIKKNYPNVKVIYTRDKDVFVELNERASIANRNNADLFISVHVNSVDGSTSTHGTETFVMGLHKNDANLAVAKRENSVILQEDNYSSKYDGFDPNDPESNIIFSLFQNAYSDQSLLLAASIEEEFKTLKRYDRGVKQAGFLVLWKTAMPSILTELGFISNPEEEQYLKSDAGQTELAVSIYNAFAKYKSQYDKSSVYLEKIPARPQQTQQPKEQTAADPDNAGKANETAEANKPQENGNAVVVADKPKEPVQKTEDNSGIQFKVQVRMSPKELEINEKNFAKYTDKVSYYVHDGSYKYTVGSETDYNAILKFFHEVKSSYPGCFIIALKDGKRIDLNEAIKATKK